MKLKLTILILTMICVSLLIPATGQQPAQAYPAPTGHVIGGNEGNGRVPAVVERETKERLVKPTPAPSPYPEPAPELQAEAYPAPGEGLPGVADPVFIPDDPQPWIPYVWGIFMASDGNFKVFVTIQTNWPVFDMVGGACIMSTAPPYAVTCYDLHARYYNGETGTMTYTSDDIQLCGWFMVQAADLDDIPADIRQPNLYSLRCVFLPWLRKYLY